MDTDTGDIRALEFTSNNKGDIGQVNTFD